MPKLKSRVYKLLKNLSQQEKKGIAWLIDPDKLILSEDFLKQFDWVKYSDLDFIFIGGSHLRQDNFSEAILFLKKLAGNIPIVIFPGSQMQIDAGADAVLFLSLISGRNPEFLIGHQVAAAPSIAKMDIEVLPTAYMIINDSNVTSVQYVSQTIPLPNSKPHLASATALAGKYLGMKFFFLDAGSGAAHPVSNEVVSAVKKSIEETVIVGGGIDTIAKLQTCYDAGADLVVIGNAIEENPGFLAEVLTFKKLRNTVLNVN